MKKVKKGMIILLSILVILGLVTVLVLQLPTFGGTASGARLERIQHSPQYKNGTFAYPLETPMMNPESSWFKLLQAYLKPSEGREPERPLPSVKTNLKTLTGAEPVLVWFGHSSYFLRINGKNLLVDPVFSGRTSPFQFVGSKAYSCTEMYAADDFPELDAIIISHDHYDHLDYDTILKLASRTKHFHVALGVGSHLERWGVKPEAITEYDWYESGKISDDLELTATPGRHFSGRALKRGQTLWNSYVLKTPTQKIFLGGDSGYGPHFKEIGEKYGPFSLALLECGQYNAMWHLIHMMPEETAQAAKDLKTEVLMPVHWGKFTLALHPWKEPIERVTKKAQELQQPITTPRIGELVHIGSNYPTDHWWNGY
ncbi:MBL fold metallo-hydrolase [Siphonobacter sp. SORGH_AS_0500]|uniref:MBL fold metallo-hydrolase n=1 Tax=Siphonobacter sp. SORGH_AS_0500 TaxID=1864824 RepID=UPI000CBCF536|nr:MBL fold metallo-hydrolase [Siphonobacter sp. SORGH_AS_0500]PKK38010.1 MBL fold metallo-hydrolase [Siphonobacter sp. SORGH_AS_0500]